MNCRPHSHLEVLLLWVNKMAKSEDLSMSTNGDINSRWCLEGVHGLRQFANIHTVIGTLPLENWFNVCEYSGALKNMHLELQLLN